MTNSVVIIPTYNEIGNIKNTLNKIENLSVNFSIIIVDDNSPDGTAKLVNKIIDSKKLKSKITLINRKEKNGLGSAYIEGFKKALNQNYDYIFQLDCDGSHDPNELIKLSSPQKKEPTIFLWPEGIIPDTYLGDMKIYKNLFSQSF